MNSFPFCSYLRPLAYPVVANVQQGENGRVVFFEHTGNVKKSGIKEIEHARSIGIKVWGLLAHSLL